MDIRVTLSDGTRTRIAADDIASVEPLGRGALVHLNSGEILSVAQDARTMELRIDAILSPQSRATATPELPTVRTPVKAADRIKRYLAGRASFGALTVTSVQRA